MYLAECLCQTLDPTSSSRQSYAMSCCEVCSTVDMKHRNGQKDVAWYNKVFGQGSAAKVVVLSVGYKVVLHLKHKLWIKYWNGHSDS